MLPIADLGKRGLDTDEDAEADTGCDVDADVDADAGRADADTEFITDGDVNMYVGFRVAVGTGDVYVGRTVELEAVGVVVETGVAYVGRAIELEAVGVVRTGVGCGRKAGV